MSRVRAFDREYKRRRHKLCFAVAFLCAFLLWCTLAWKGYPPSGQGSQAAISAEGTGAPGSEPKESWATGGKPPERGGQENRATGVRPAIRKALKPKPIPEDWIFTIISTGDIMMHSPQTKAGWRRESQSYDFSFMFEKVAPILREGDLVIGNLETPLAGEANGGFTGYPLFNAPEALAENLKWAGFTLVSTANNHSLDRGFKGLCATLDHLDKAGLMHTGSFRTPEEQRRVLLTKVKGVEVALIAATYGTNGLKLPAENSFALNYIDEARLLEDIQQARRQGARYVIIMLHWGVEYQPKANRDQEALAYSLLRGGADLILGNHPHVLQQSEAIQLEELYTGQPQNAAQADTATIEYKASGKDRQKFVIYSQGNFVSNQEGLERNCSLLLKLTVGVDGATGEPYLKDAGYIPIFTQKRNREGVSQHTVWPLELALAELEAGGQAFGAGDRANIPKAWEYVQKSQPNLALLNFRDTPIWRELPQAALN